MDYKLFGCFEIEKWRSFCRVFRIIIGLILITIGAYTVLIEEPVYLWFLGALPLIAGSINFCPACIITKKCDLDECQPLE